MDKFTYLTETLRNKFVKTEVREVYVKEDASSVSDRDSNIPKDVQAGELDLEESAAGGLGRHLGVFSTTFLMYFFLCGCASRPCPTKLTTLAALAA